jgi:hypothetical protein
MSTGGPDKQRTTKLEKAEVRQAIATDKRHQEQYKALEIFEIEQWRDPAIREINKSVLQGKISADIAQKEYAAYGSAIAAAQASGAGLSGGANVKSFQDVALAGQKASAEGDLEAEQIVQGIHDAEGLSIVRTGEGVNRGNTENLAAAAANANYSAASKLQASMQVNQARAKALGDIATTAVIGGADAFKRARGDTPSEQLSPGAKTMRDLFGQRSANQTASAPPRRGWADNLRGNGTP